MEGHLYAAGDASVCPATPAALRSGGGRTGTKGGGAGAGMTGAGRGAAESVGDGLPCGYSDAPGWRIEMEDAVCRCCCGSVLLLFLLFAVCVWRCGRNTSRCFEDCFFWKVCRHVTGEVGSASRRGAPVSGWTPSYICSTQKSRLCSVTFCVLNGCHITQCTHHEVL